MTMSSTTFVRRELAQSLPPPVSLAGPLGWMRANLFSSIPHAILTVIGGYVAFKLLWIFIDFTLIRAVWTGADRDACLDEKVGRHVGACWPFVQAKFAQFMYGFYPVEERWRVNLTGIIAVILLVPLLIPSVGYKVLNAILFFGLFPILAFVLLQGGSIINPWLGVIDWLAILAALGLLIAYLLSLSESGMDERYLFVGGLVLFVVAVAIWFLRPDWFELHALVGLGVLIACVLSLMEPRANVRLLLFSAAALAVSILAFGVVRGGWFDLPALPVVETRQWGGLLVTLVVAVTGIVAALPIGVALALGRRSKLPIIRFLSVALIELVRGVPLITVLFFATYMLPLFLERSPDPLMRVLVGASIFSGAYMAEVIRGGLQAIPKGQFEGAQALGLNYPRMMGLVILPQALKLVIPGIVNSFIGLFKDTTLVSIVAIFDLLGGMRAGFTDPQWASPVTLYTGFAFAGIIYFSFCYFMSRYSIFVENRLNKGRRH
ncbi:amino acid ABC transporter permease [Phreatobacter stygius]|uniref:Amino acid ABC transporter permease n=1 Tax=Phreatobacter stygius TaxID=1940610 RepID=A0A4D7BGD8_9HYPH|nr:amino acid ABC transporter permease [Phreatobacter stygius]QCI68828.1 amino acid ABC transporter permease [Phreatobacter stygius]